MRFYSYASTAVIYIATLTPWLLFTIAVLSILISLFKRQSEGSNFQFRIKLVLYFLAFSLYNIIALVGGFLVIILPFAYGFLSIVYPQTFPEELLYEKFLGIEVGNYILSSFLVTFLLGGYIMSSITNPLDYGRTKKRFFIPTQLHRLLDNIINITPKVSARNIIKSNDNEQQNNIKQNEYTTKLQHYENYRYQKYRADITNQVRKSLWRDLLVLILLTLQFAAAVYLHNTYGSEVELWVGMLVTTGVFSVVFWFGNSIEKRRGIEHARTKNIGSRDLTCKYLQEVKTEFKRVFVVPLVTKEFDYVYNTGYINNLQISLDVLRKSPLLRIRDVQHDYIHPSDQLTTKHTNDIKSTLIDFQILERVSKRNGHPGLKGLYIETVFEERFTGEVWVISKNKLYNSRQFINVPNTLGEIFETESIDFNKQFFVYTTNQIEARLALKTNVMLNLLELSKHNKYMYILLKNKKVYLFLDSDIDFFEYPYMNSNRIDWSNTSIINPLTLYQKQISLPLIITKLLNPRRSNELKKRPSES